MLHDPQIRIDYLQVLRFALDAVRGQEGADRLGVRVARQDEAGAAPRPQERQQLLVAAVRAVDGPAARARRRERPVEVEREARGRDARRDRGDHLRRTALEPARGARVRVAHEAAPRVRAPGRWGG